MDILLIFFSLPVATIILASVFQTILRCPLSVSATFFAIYLIVTFAFFDANFLIAAIIYTILAYISAALTKLIINVIERLNSEKINDNSKIIENLEMDNINTLGNREINGTCVDRKTFNLGKRENIYRC